MEGVTGRLTVYFDDPYWVGVFEREFESKLEVCRVVFGAEPGDAELQDFLLTQWNQLRFGKTVDSNALPERRLNPKRLQRFARRETQNIGIGTKAQQALKLQMEVNKTERRERNKQRNDQMEEHRFWLKQEKRKEKHRGH